MNEVTKQFYEAWATDTRHELARLLQGILTGVGMKSDAVSLDRVNLDTFFTVSEKAFEAGWNAAHQNILNQIKP
jgi:hypothetical protein